MCGTHYSEHYRPSPTLVADSPSAGPGHLRASDEDRERAAARLRDHCAEGRLTAEELDERLGVAYRARTLAELDDLFEDLPAAPLSSRREHPAASWRRAPVPVAVALVAALAVLAVAGGAHGAWLVGPLVFVWLRRGRHAPGRLGRGPWPRGRPPGAPRWL